MRTPPVEDVRIGTESRSRRALTSLGLLCACALIGVLSAAQNYYVDRAEGESVTWAAMLWSQMTYWIIWGVFLPFIVYATRKISRIPRFSTQVAVHVAVGLLTVLLHSLVVYGVRSIFAAGVGRPSSFALYVRGWMIFNLVIYSALVAGALAVEHWRRGRAHELRAARLGLALSRAQWRTLQMQLHPHFLFNTLNTVAMLIRTGDGPRALTMIAGLGDLLRQILDDAGQQEVSLREELAFLERYLGIERVRFSDRLRVRIAAEPESMEAFVPRFMLQPLVENAIRHGIEKRTDSGALTITANRADGVLRVAVEDDGPGPPQTPSSGVGLSNARERLRYLYGDGASLSLASVPGGGAVATVVLPWHDRALDGSAS